MEKWGRIDGWIHAAGSAGEKALRLLPETDEKTCGEQYAAKARGSYVLEKVLKGKDVDFCLLMSSNASVLGGLGSFGYSSANLFLDEFANNRSESNGTRWISANWDGWLTEDDTRLSSSFQTSLDQFAMLPEESIEAFRRVVASKLRGQIVVSTGDLSARLDLWVRSGGNQRGDSSGSNVLPPQARRSIGTAYAPPGNEIEQVISSAWQDLLGIDQVGIHDNFFELGGNSLIGLKVISRLNRELNAEIPIVALFEGPTVNLLSKLISSNGHQATDYGANRSRGERRREKRRQKQRSAQVQNTDISVH
jgi:hypothetical protein